MSAEESKSTKESKPKAQPSENVQWYIYIYNLCQLASWIYIVYFLKEALLALMDANFMPTPKDGEESIMVIKTESEIARELADEVVKVIVANQLVSWLELVHAMFGYTQSRPQAVIYQNGLRSWHTFGALLFSSKFMESRGFILLVFAWTFAELIRYNFYILTSTRSKSSLFGRTITMLRYNAFVILYPVGGVAEFLLDWDFFSHNFSAYNQDYLFWGLVVAYIALFPGLFMNMWVQRSKFYRAQRLERMECQGETVKEPSMGEILTGKKMK